MPKMPPEGSSLDSARIEQSLRDTISRMAPGASVAPGRQLAASYGVSPRTIARVMARLRSAGVVTRVRGRGTFAGPPRRPPSTPPVSSPELDCDITALVRNMVCDGSLMRGESLPQVKTLCARLHVSPARVSRALRELSASGLLCRTGRSYRVGTATQVALTPTPRVVHVINARSDDFSMIFSQLPAAFAFRRMETELTASGCSIEYWERSRANRLCANLASATAPAAGVVVCNIDDETWETVSSTVTRLRQLSASRGHRLVLTSYRRLEPAPPLVHVSLAGQLGTVQARALARFLCSKRYHDICFYARGPQSPLIDPFALEIPLYAKLHAELTRLVPEARLTFALHAQPRRLSREQAFEAIARGFKTPYLESIMGQYRSVPPGQFERELRLCGSPAEAIAQIRARAYVCVQDEDAVAVVDSARKLRLRVPADIAAVGLVNDARYLHRNLTCCVPDWERLGYLLAHAAIGDIPIARSSQGFVRASALMLERSTA